MLLITLWHSNVPQSHSFLITCKFCVEDLFVLLPDLFLVVFKQSLTQVAHLLQCKRGLVLSWGTWEIKIKSAMKLVEPLAYAPISQWDRKVLSPEIDALSQAKMYSFAFRRLSPLPANGVVQR